MDIAIVGRHTKVSDELRKKIDEKMEKIQTLAPTATRAEVHVVHERNPRMAGDSERIEITIYGRRVVRAEAAAADRIAALEAASDKVILMLRKLHERKAKRHQGKVGLHALPPLLPEVVPEISVDAVAEWEEKQDSSVQEMELDGTPIVIRAKRHSAKPMTVAEAVDQMELVGHDFFLFIDADSGLPSAVYRRRGWTYGVIHLEQEAAEAAPVEDKREIA